MVHEKFVKVKVKVRFASRETTEWVGRSHQSAPSYRDLDRSDSQTEVGH